jgi:hypothetical protein
MRAILFMLFFAAVASAFMVEPDYFDIHDTGSESLPTLDVRMMINCETKDLIVTVSSDGWEPVEGASTVLFYTDYGYQALPNPGTTDSNGSVTMPVTGNLDFLTGLFILRVDKSGYQSREIEFAYEKCFEDPPPEPEPPMNDTPPVNETEPEPPVINESIPEPEPPVVNDTPEINETPVINENQSVSEPEESASTCAAGFVLLSLLCVRVMR